MSSPHNSRIFGGQNSSWSRFARHMLQISASRRVVPLNEHENASSTQEISPNTTPTSSPPASSPPFVSPISSPNGPYPQITFG